MVKPKLMLIVLIGLFTPIAAYTSTVSDQVAMMNLTKMAVHFAPCLSWIGIKKTQMLSARTTSPRWLILIKIGM